MTSQEIVRIKHALRGPYWIGETMFDAPPPPGFLHGSSPPPGPIVGILDLCNRTRMGFSSRGVPQYLFHPLDVRLPPMIVGSRAPTNVNQWATVRWDRWDIVRDRWPRANLEQLLGAVGDPAVEIAALRKSVTKPNNPNIVLAPFLEQEAGDEDVWDVCFNIDPTGCRDVDDVIAWKYGPTGAVKQFAIAIADVAACVPEGSLLDLVAAERAQTVYDDAGTVVQPMLPTEISEGRASLLADGRARGVVALVWDLGEGSDVGEPTWHRMRLRNKAAFTYESFVGSQWAPTCKAMLERCCGGIGLTSDTHEWIERAMVTYNVHAARRLVACGTGLLRVHEGRVGAGADALAEGLKTLAATTGHPEIAILGFAAGRYTAVTAADAAVGHAGIGVPLYCHASSPLRRYADLVNQRVLVGGVCGVCGVCGDEVVEALNARAKEIKAFERNLWCIKQLSSARLSEAEGILIDCKELGAERCLKVWVPAWKRVVKSSAFLAGPTADSVQPKDSQDIWIVHKGDRVRVQAFWDLQAPRQENRFVFRITQSA